MKTIEEQIEAARKLLATVRRFELPDGVVVRRSRLDRTDWIVEHPRGANMRNIEWMKAHPNEPTWTYGVTEDYFFPTAADAFRGVIWACDFNHAREEAGPLQPGDNEHLIAVVDFCKNAIVALTGDEQIR